MTEQIKTGTYRIEVTEEDIKCGEKNNSETCAIALAARRALGKVVSVDDADYIYFDGIRGYDLTPERPARNRINSFIQAFDAGIPVEPFSFNLEVDIDSDYENDDYEF